MSRRILQYEGLAFGAVLLVLFLSLRHWMPCSGLIVKIEKTLKRVKDS